MRRERQRRQGRSGEEVSRERRQGAGLHPRDLPLRRGEVRRGSFDDRLIAVDEFHHVSANPDNKLGDHVGQFIARDKVHIVAMTGSYFRGDAEAVLHPQDEAKFETVTYTYYEQLNGYEYLKQLDIGYFFYPGPIPTTF